MRVGSLLLRLLAVAAILAGSVAAAIWLLGTSSSSPGQTEPAASALPRQASAAGVRAGGAATPESSSADAAEQPSPSLMRAGAAASWERLTRSTPAELGLAVAPLGHGRARTFGPLQAGHAWSTIKVPILVTLMRERGGRGLSAEEERWAHEALTASDNEAAAALFAQLEAPHGGLAGASRAVQATLRRSGDRSTVVATAPPPSGAVSTYGQTEWSLPASVEFFRALGRGCLLDRADTAYVLSLMEEVVAEQRWGLGEAGFPAGRRVGMKGGWGPEGSASGAYLVRQSGIVGPRDTGVAVAMVARANSGSFEAGVEAIDRVAAWLAGNLRSPGPSAKAPC